MNSENKVIVGPARVASRQGSFLTPPPQGSVLIVDLPDLAVESAEKLLASEPTAVLNASASRTGRTPATGTRLILEAGVPVVDNIGGSILGVAEGEEVSITGPEVEGKSGFRGHGRVVSIEALTSEDDRVRLGARIESYALSAWSSFNQEADLILSGLGLPDVPVLRGRLTVVVPPTVAPKQLRKLMSRLATYDPIVIAVGAGANQVHRAKTRPNIIVGDAGDVESSVFRRAKHVILSTPPTRRTVKSLKQHSIGYQVVFTDMSDADVALLLAYHGGARVIVDASRPKSVPEFFDRDATPTAGDLLTLVQVSDRLISADAAMAFDRSPVSAWLLVLLLVVGLVAAGAAILVTPWGQSLLALLTTGGFFG